jgi:glycosyltransferase involved in cell wall biosynthesis
VPASAVRRLLARSHAMVISSVSEGGANVISEAAVAGVPILASRMDGNLGLLGAGYPGYFPVGGTRALARLLQRIEVDPAFVQKLTRAVTRQAALFRPRREQMAWRHLLADVASKRLVQRVSNQVEPPCGSTRASRPLRSEHARRRL